MPVHSTHKDYDKFLSIWVDLRAIAEGEHKVKQLGQRFLPMPCGRSADEYNSYVQRAVFFDATSKTVAGWTGLLHRSTPQTDIPDQLEYLLDDANGMGVPLHDLAKKTTSEVLSVGRQGLLVDYPSLPTERTLADEADLNANARIYTYDAECVLNWRYQKVGSAYKLALVVLREVIDEVDTDGFGTTEYTQYRTLQLDEEGLYFVEVYREISNGGDNEQEEFGITEQYFPTNSEGSRLDYIPFVFVGSTDLTADIDKSPICDISNINVAHYRNSADYEEALFIVGQPTPWFSGLSEHFIDNHFGKIRFGSRSALLLEQGATAGLIQMDNNADSLHVAMQEKEKQMVALGAKVLEANRQGVERAETLRTRQNGESSELAGIGNNISRAYTICLRWIADFMGVPSEDISYELNGDFFPERLTPQEMTALVGAWQSGLITQETAFLKLQEGEVIRADADYDEYSSELESEAEKNLDSLNRGLDDEMVEPLSDQDDEEEEAEEDPDL